MRYDVRRGIRAPLLLVAALGLLAAACSSGSGNGSSSSSGGPETSTITLGSLPVVDAAPAYIADKAGYFKQEGLTVKFQQAQGGAALIPSLVSGDIQIAFSNWVSLFLAKSQGIDLTLIADGDKARPGFSGVFVMPNSPIKTPADLAGKKIAVNTLNNVGGLVISAVLQSQGVDPKSIKFVEVGFPDMGATLQRGDVDAVWVVEPFTTAVKATLNARAIIDPFSGPTAALPVGGYAVTKQFADKNPKTVAALFRALDKAVAEAITRLELVDPRYLPRASTVLARLVELLGQAEFLTAVAATLQAWAIGLAIAVAAAVPAGILLGSSRRCYQATRALVEFLRPIPSVALIPLAILLFGQGLQLKTSLIAYASFWPLLFNTVYGVQDVDPIAKDTARSFGLGRLAVLGRVTLPAASPFIATGVRVASAIALILALSTELLAGAA